MTLGDLGADVIKVERPITGDDTRSWGPPWVGSTSTYYLTANRNKRSITLDLSLASDRVLAKRLAQRADVLIENFMPGTMQKYGLGYDDLHELNPRLIYCSITGFGTKGAGASLPGYDFLVQAASGLMSITGENDGPPLKVGAALVDMICGLYATTGILAALQARHSTNEGQLLEVSLMDAALSSLLNQGSAFLNAGNIPERQGNRHPSIVPYQLYNAADASIVIAVGSDGIWRRLCDAMDLTSLKDDSRFTQNCDRVININELNAILAKKFGERPANQWIDLLTAAGVPAGSVNNVEQGYALAEKLEAEPIITTLNVEGNTIRTARSPLRMSGTPVTVRTAPPMLGEHNAEIRHWLEQQ